MRFHIIAAAAIALAGCSVDTAADEESATVRGRVSGYVTSGDTLVLGDVRIVARAVGDDAAEDTILAETVSGPDGSFSLDVPSRWVTLAFEHEGYETTVRTEDFSYLAVRTGFDVHLPIAAEPFQFQAPEPGGPATVLTVDSPAGRDYATVRIEAGDLVDARGEPVEGTLTARIHAAHPRDTHKDAFTESLYAATESRRIVPFSALGMLSLDLQQGGHPVSIASGETLEWKVVVPDELREEARTMASAGMLHEYSFVPTAGLWAEASPDVAFDGRTLTVERSTLDRASIGYAGTSLRRENGEAAARAEFRDSPDLCVDPGRSAVVLLTLSNPRTPVEVAENIIETSVAYVGRGGDKVLVVLDDNHNNEFVGDAAYIGRVLRAAGYDVDVMNEPSAGLQSHHVADYSVVWLTNPGYPVDDRATLDTLDAFRAAGGGYVLSGDDMTIGEGGFDMSRYTFVKFKDNGTTTCGVHTDNNAGASFRITFDETDHLLAAGLDGVSFLYGDDIDHSVPLNDGEAVLAWARLEGYPSCNVRIPIVIAIDINDSSVRPTCECSDDNECLGAQHCFGNECVSCSTSGYSCGADSDCCGDLVCNADGVCGEPCGTQGEACGAGGGDCCGSLSCLGGACDSCGAEGGACEADSDCCGGLLCVEGTCLSCRDEGESCGEASDCCGGGALDCRTTTVMQEAASERCSGARTLRATIRDFSKSHADFEYRSGSETGIVEAELGSDGKPVYAGNPTTYTTNGRLLFDQWYRDVPGVNRSFPFDIELTEVADGVYQYKNNSLFPIDGRGFGNEGNSHNYHFTLELHTEFVYRPGDVFTFTGDDDLFAYIDGQLVIDLGGVHSKLSRTVDLDDEAHRLGLVPGETYSLDIFFAERHTSASNFRIDTTIACLGEPERVEVTAPHCAPRIDEVRVESCGADDGVVALGSVTVSGSARIASGSAPGNAASNGDIVAHGSAVIDGDAATSGGTITVTGGSRIQGRRITDATRVVADLMEDEFARVRIENDNLQVPQIRKNNNKLVSPIDADGDFVLQDNSSLVLPGGEYSFRSFKLNGSAVMTCTGAVAIYVTGEISIAGNSRLNDDGGCHLVLYSNDTDDVSLGGSANATAYVYAPLAEIDVTGNSRLTGGAFGTHVNVSGSSRIVNEGSVMEEAGICEVSDGSDPVDEDEDEEDDEMPDLPDLPNLPE